MIILPLLIIEWGFKIFFAFKVGPSILLPGKTGTKKEMHTHKFHANRIRYKKKVENYNKRAFRYSKYFPYQKVFDYDTNSDEAFTIVLNNNGFRGRDFDKKKKADTIRVVALGASSTFGFMSRDNQTYPYYMEQILNSRCKGTKSFEVLNLGIPHLESNKILALFLEEVIPLNPDVVTFYEGINDTTLKPHKGKQEKSGLRHMLRWISKYVLFVKFIRFTISNFNTFSEQDVNGHVKGRSRRFLKNLSIIYEECKKNGIKFIVANQQARAVSYLIFHYPQDRGLTNDGKPIKGITYQREVEMIRDGLSKAGYINKYQLRLLVHSILMRDLGIWASENNIPFVDVIEALDQNRDTLLTYVHLSPRGNRMVAEEFAGKILENVPCQL